MVERATSSKTEKVKEARRAYICETMCYYKNRRYRRGEVYRTADSKEKVPEHFRPYEEAKADWAGNINDKEPAQALSQLKSIPMFN